MPRPAPRADTTSRVTTSHPHSELPDGPDPAPSSKTRSSDRCTWGPSRPRRCCWVAMPLRHLRIELLMTAYVASRRRLGAGLLALTTASAAFLLFAPDAHAAIVPTVPLGTAANY